MIDVYVAADQQHRVHNKNIQVQSILKEKIGYGVVLSGPFAEILQRRCYQYVKRNEEDIIEYIKNNTNYLEVNNLIDMSYWGPLYEVWISYPLISNNCLKKYSFVQSSFHIHIW